MSMKRMLVQPYSQFSIDMCLAILGLVFYSRCSADTSINVALLFEDVQSQYSWWNHFCCCDYINANSLHATPYFLPSVFLHETVVFYAVTEKGTVGYMRGMANLGQTCYMNTVS